MSDRKLLEIKNLVTEFSTDGNVLKAVNDVSFTLNRGETIGIVGESGSGKSVTSLSVMRLIPNPPGTISGGEILFHKDETSSVDLVKIPENEMRAIRGNDIAMIFQEPMTSLNPVFTCGDQVMEAILLHQKVSKKEAKEKTIALFKEVQLPRPEDIFEAYPHQISGGQKQRIAIARAILRDAPVLLLDEATSALDAESERAVQMAVDELSQGRTTLIVAHRLATVKKADRIVVLDAGRIVATGTHDALVAEDGLYARLARLQFTAGFEEA